MVEQGAVLSVERVGFGKGDGGDALFGAGVLRLMSCGEACAATR